MAHLEHLQAVVGHIQAAGGQLVAISPMRQEDLKDTLLHDFLVRSTVAFLSSCVSKGGKRSLLC